MDKIGKPFIVSLVSNVVEKIASLPFFWQPVIVSLIVTPICLFIGIISVGSGEGDYFMAKMLFPYTLTLGRLYSSFTTQSLIWLAIVQFPIYGLALVLCYINF